MLGCFLLVAEAKEWCSIGATSSPTRPFLVANFEQKKMLGIQKKNHPLFLKVEHQKMVLLWIVSKSRTANDRKLVLSVSLCRWTAFCDCKKVSVENVSSGGTRTLATPKKWAFQFYVARPSLGVRVPHIKDSSKVAPFSKRRLRCILEAGFWGWAGAHLRC